MEHRSVKKAGIEIQEIKGLSFFLPFRLRGTCWFYVGMCKVLLFKTFWPQRSCSDFHDFVFWEFSFKIGTKSKHEMELICYETNYSECCNCSEHCGQQLFSNLCMNALWRYPSPKHQECFVLSSLRAVP